MGSEKPQEDKDVSGKTNLIRDDHITMDEIYHEIGEFDRWQWMNMALMWLPSAASGLMLIGFSFAGLRPPSYRCAYDCELENATFIDFNKSIFSIKKNGDIDYCHYRPMIPNSDKCDMDEIDFNADFIECNPRDESTKMIFGEFEMDSTIVTDYGLLCNDSFRLALMGSVFMLGMIVGAGGSGKLSDTFGRKPAVYVTLFVGALSQLLSGFVTSSEAFCFLRFLTAVGTCAFLPAFTLSVELVGSKYRTMAGILIEIPFAIGEALAGLLAIFIHDWRVYQYVLSVPVFLLLFTYFIAPESPRWLLTSGKTTVIKNSIAKIEKMNGKTLSKQSQRRLSEMLHKMEQNVSTEQHEDQEGEEVTLKDAFIHPVMRSVIMIMAVNWMVVTLGYYGISMIAVEIGSNAYVSSILAALIEIPSYIFCIICMDKLGRKPICVFCFFLTGICCIPAGYLPGDFQTAFALLGKFGDSAAFALVFLYTAELFPTKIRSTVVGICSMAARVGGIVAPQVVLYLPTVTSQEAPMIVMGTCALIAASASIFLPESLGSLTIQTIEDVDNLKNVGKPFFAYWSDERLKKHIYELTEKKQMANLSKPVVV